MCVCVCVRARARVYADLTHRNNRGARGPLRFWGERRCLGPEEAQNLVRAIGLVRVLRLGFRIQGLDLMVKEN